MRYVAYQGLSLKWLWRFTKADIPILTTTPAVHITLLTFSADSRALYTTFSRWWVSTSSSSGDVTSSTVGRTCRVRWPITPTTIHRTDYFLVTSSESVTRTRTILSTNSWWWIRAISWSSLDTTATSYWAARPFCPFTPITVSWKICISIVKLPWAKLHV